MNDKENRKMAVSDLIKSAKIHTQEELMQALQARGVEVAQATLSRYIKELGAVKSSGPDGKSYYAIGSTPQVRTHISVDGIEISGQICVLRSQPGFASAIASVVDGAHLPGVMGTIAGDDTVLVMLRADADSAEVSGAFRRMFDVSDVTVRVALPSDTAFAKEIVDEIYVSSQERKTGIARRTPEYISEKILAGKAVIAVTSDGEFAGFSYIESWGGKAYVANSGLIVAHKFRGQGIAKRIKEQTFLLSRTLFPDAKIFSITTGAAVMKMNYQFGFRPVPFTELTDDPEFWKGCRGCRHFDILKSHDYKMCICTGLLYDPKEKGNE